MKYCETCRHRTEDGTCASGKFEEDGSFTDEQRKDMVIYPYQESGVFWVGEKFGCIHHEAVEAVETVDATVAINRLLKEIDKLHALAMQVLEEVKKSREERKGAK